MIHHTSREKCKICSEQKKKKNKSCNRLKRRQWGRGGKLHLHLERSLQSPLCCYGDGETEVDAINGHGNSPREGSADTCY